MNKTIITTEEELSQIIAKAFNNELHQFLSGSSLLKPQSPPLSEILDLEGAAEFLHLAPSSIYGLVHRNKIPFSKPAGKLIFKRSDLLDWIDSGAVKPQGNQTFEVGIFTRKPSKQ